MACRGGVLGLVMQKSGPSSTDGYRFARALARFRLEKIAMTEVPTDMPRET